MGSAVQARLTGGWCSNKLESCFSTSALEPEVDLLNAPDVEDTHEFIGPPAGRTLLVMRVALVALVVVVLSAAGWRGASQARRQTGSAGTAVGPQSKLVSLAVVGELPRLSSESLVRVPVEVALARQAENPAGEAEVRRLSEEKRQAIDATTLPELGLWNGSAPLPGSEVHDVMSMPMLDGEKAPVVALTFDDGPSEFTAEIVSILEEEQVPATFFFIGRNVRNRPADARMVADAGFAVATHTMDHPDLRRLSPAATKAELAESTAAIDGLLGEGTVQCARAPYGAFTDDTLRVAKDLGLGLVGWDVHTADWEERDSDRIVERATVPQQRRIILLHDGGGPRQATVEALPDLIAHFKSQGARFIKLCGATSPDGDSDGPPSG